VNNQSWVLLVAFGCFISGYFATEMHRKLRTQKVERVEDLIAHRVDLRPSSRVISMSSNLSSRLVSSPSLSLSALIEDPDETCNLEGVESLAFVMPLHDCIAKALALTDWKANRQPVGIDREA
jgi:hypothetical protein